MAFTCPGCKVNHIFRTIGYSPTFSWDGLQDKANIIPEMIFGDVGGDSKDVRSNYARQNTSEFTIPVGFGRREIDEKAKNKRGKYCCCIVLEGHIHFSEDCEHHLAGTVVKMIDYIEDPSKVVLKTDPYIPDHNC